MKKSKIVTLVIITAALASCNKKVENDGASGDWGDEKGGKKVYMRSDTTAQYTRTHHSGMGMGSMLLWYYAFRPYHGGGYGGYRSGYYSGGLSHSSNVGSNPAKSGISRGGFGRSSFRSSAS
jgi:hypothetical protein